ncbi:9142_t:CDS:2 [Acaulospora colombiana]|uniref:9142_t:CDS:1 n=1 Tax=Acaulospora colombiana TaxID=27376 RepID=A0ACA9L4Y4_9GLOM|nr:9142_t:CDS:2 [Acaulospora colombiana]
MEESPDTNFSKNVEESPESNSLENMEESSDSNFAKNKKEITDFSKYLNSWYSKACVEYVDLAGDFGGSGLFIVEGDSLIFNFLHDPDTHLLDFGETFGGGQFLALTFLVEKFIDELKQRGCRFHIVVFDAHKAIWNDDPKLRVAREIVLSHLKSYQHVTKVPIYEFDNWWGSEFAEYIEERLPLFILLGDGTTKDLEMNSVDVDSSKASIIWRGLIYHTLHNDLSAALIPGMEFRDSRAKAFVFGRDGNVTFESFAAVTEIVSLCKNILEENKLSRSVADFVLSDDKNLLNSNENQSIWKKGGKRVALVFISLIGILRNKSSPEYWSLARLFLLHVYLLDNIALKSRTLPQLSEETENSAIKFMDHFFVYCSHTLINGVLNEALRNFEDLNHNLADLLDARIFASLVKFQKDGDLSFDKLPKDFKQDFDAAWNLLKSLFHDDEIVDSISRYSKKLPKLEFATYKLYDIKLSLLPIDFKLFSDYLHDVELGYVDEDEIEVDTEAYGLSGSIPFEDFTIWLSSESNESSGLREYQKYVRFMERYARSLDGTQGFYTLSISTEKKQAEAAVEKSSSSKKLLERIEKEKLEKSLKESEQYLERAIAEVSKIEDIMHKLEYLKTKISKEDKLKHPASIIRAQFYKSHVPILALSATVGNPDEFKNWIESVQKNRGYKTRIIKTTKRYSDLAYFSYIPKYPLKEFNTLNPKECEDTLFSIHPFSTVSPILVAENGIPPDIKMVPRQCVEFWDVMNKVSNGDPDIQPLDPDKYFKDIGYIVKDDVDQYEDDLKRVFESWARDSTKSAHVREIISSLDNFKDRFAELENKAKEDELDVYDNNFLKHSIAPLLTEQVFLSFFLFVCCNSLAMHLEQQLREAEKLKRENDPVYQAKKKNAISQKEYQEKMKKRTRDRDPKKKSKADDDDDAEDIEEPPPTIFDWEAHDPDFTFVSPRHRMPELEYEELKNTFRYKMTGELSGILDALDRGRIL